MIVRTARDIGAMIRAARLRAGLTQAELAKRLGTSQRWVSQIERGKTTAEIGMVLRAMANLRIVIDLSHGDDGSARKEDPTDIKLFLDLDSIFRN